VSMTYPDGYTLDYNYNSGLDASISRLSSISDSTGVLESYKYLGLDTVVERDHPQIDVNQTLISQNGQTGAAGDQYVGLDQFGRVVNDNWYNTSTGQSTDDFVYGYDEDGNVLYKQNLVDAAMSELYQYNNLDELIYFARGTLNSSDNGIVGTPSASQSWTPDALGNFDSVTTNGSTQTETANQQNQITSISGSGTISYDANGNLTADGSGNTYVYNAWNELVAVKSSNGATIASYGYDGLGRQITQTEGGTTTDLYYSSADQVLEEDVGGVAQARNVWSPVYVNALVLRDQSSQHNGTLDQRLYVQQDANWNVTALVNTSGTVVERYSYTPYGVVTVLNPDFSVRGVSAYSWVYTYQGARQDPSTGLYRMGQRDYSPTLSRWVEQDPGGYVNSLNVYEMELDEPTAYVDPTGEGVWDFVKGAAKGFVGAVAGAVVVGGLVAVATVASPVIAVSAAVAAIGVTAYGGYQFGKTIFEAATGEEAYTGRVLQPGERHEAAGLVVGGLLGGRAIGRTLTLTRMTVETRFPARLRAPAGSRPLGRLTPCPRTQMMVGGRTIAQRVAAAGVQIADDALVNFGSTARGSVNPAVSPMGTTRSYWFQYGEIKHLTLQQVQAVIGDLASAGQPGGANVLRVGGLPRSQFTPRPPSNMAGIPEFIVDKPVPVDVSVPVGD